MSLRTFERVLLASSLALSASAFVGCSDGGGSSGGADSGSDAGDAGTDSAVDEPDDAGSDAGNPATPPTLTNAKGEKCAPVPLTSAGTWAEACWIDTEAETGCGVDGNKLPGGDPTSGKVACVAQDIPGKLSTYCGEFFDLTDGLLRDGDKKIIRDADGNPTFDMTFDDGALTVSAGSGVKLRFEGCCLPTGQCGAMLSEPRALDAAGKVKVKAFDGTVFNLHLGCTSVTELAGRLADPDAESLPTTALANLPYCDYSQDDPGAPTTGALPGIPKVLCGCGEGEVPPADDYNCLPNLAPEVCGADNLTDKQLADIPVFACGSVGSTTGLPALLQIPNVDASVCGTLPVVAEDPALAQIPEILCGAVDPRPTSAGLPKLPNLSSEICGLAPVTTGSPVLATIPAFLCGCIDNDAVELGCLPNVEGTVCGAQAVTTTTASLARIPSFICGCGERRDSAIGSVCMSNTPTDVCGQLAATVNNNSTPDVTTDDCLTGVPEYAHGCGDVSPAVDPSCLRNTPRLFGCVNVTEPQPRLPEYFCGCGDGVLGANPQVPGIGANSLPCLPNVLDTVCGGYDVQAIPQVALFTPTMPNAVCGCGEGLTSAQPCLDNVVSSVCGPTAVCTTLGATGGGCPGATICRDLRGGTGAVPGDGIGDSCVAPPPT